MSINLKIEIRRFALKWYIRIHSSPLCKIYFKFFCNFVHLRLYAKRRIYRLSCAVCLCVRLCVCDPPARQTHNWLIIDLVVDEDEADADVGIRRYATNRSVTTTSSTWRRPTSCCCGHYRCSVCPHTCLTGCSATSSARYRTCFANLTNTLGY